MQRALLATMPSRACAVVLCTIFLGCGDVGGEPSSVDGGRSDRHVGEADAGRDALVSATCDGRVPLNHRSGHVECPTTRGVGLDSTDAALATGECANDTDCTAGVNGRCLARGFGAYVQDCSYDQCSDDHGCSGVPCACRPSATSSGPNYCVMGSDCVVDSDCGPCGFCSPTLDGCGGGVDSYHCHTPGDSCLDDSDCTTSTIGQSCAFQAGTHQWSCVHLQGCPP
jgi:hypothetical protein